MPRQNKNAQAGTAPDLLARELKLQRELNFESAKLMRATDAGHAAEQVAASVRLRQLFNDYEKVEAEIRVQVPHYANLTQPRPIGVDQIQEEVLTDDETVLLEYALSEMKSYVWAVTRNSFRVYQLADGRVIQAAAQRVTDLTEERSPGSSGRQNLKQATTALSKLILQPVEQKLRGKTRILIVGDDTLQLVPFSLLPVTWASAAKHALPLVARYEVATLPSAATLAILRREPRRGPPPSRLLAIFADPVFDKDDSRVHVSEKRKIPEGTHQRFFRRLLSSRREAQEISALIPESLAFKSLDFAASKAAFLNQSIGTYRIIHVSSHGFSDKAHPELSGLVFSLVDRKGRPQDGITRLYEIYNLQLSADLVTLSACGSFQGEKINGEGIVGLARGFIYAGSKTVVASLWQVDDVSTAELMRRFYQGLLGPEHLRPAAALREAQASMWKEGWPPYHWAGFTLQGEW